MMYMHQARHAFCEVLLRDLDRTISLLEQAAMSNWPAAVPRNVENAQCILADIERYLATLEFESGQKTAIHERRNALIVRLQLLML
jgi:hypothetical protein